MARSDPKPVLSTLDLAKALKLAGMVVERRNTIPVLSCAKLTRSTVEVTDLDICLRVRTDGLNAMPVKGVQVTHKALATAVADTDGTIAFAKDQKGEFLSIGQNPMVSVRCCPDDLPEARPFEEVAAFVVPARRLAADLAAVTPAMSNEETRYYLMGTFMHLAGGMLHFAATDGHRLHLVTREPPEGIAELPDSIIPRKAVRLLQAAIAALPAEETVSVSIGKLKARFDIGGITILTRLIDGTYPDYKRVIPTACTAGMKLSARELTRPASLARKLMGKNKTAMTIRAREGTIAAKDPEGYELSARLDREVVGEPAEEIGFRHEYLVDSLTPFLPHSVEMAFADSASPTRIQSDARPELLVVLMPMRV